MLKTADVTAHIAAPDGTVREEPVTKTNPTWTMTGNKLPDKACVLLTFVPKKSIDAGTVFHITFKGTVTAASFKDGKQQNYKTSSRNYSLDIQGDKLSQLYVGKTFGVALGISAQGQVVSVSESDFDFGSTLYSD